MRGDPQRWVFLAVEFYLGTTLLSTALSGSFTVSLWGEVPGQDGYPAYTIAAYVLLFTVIATHLKTRPQLWRLLGAIVAMGVLVSGYAVLQHYGHDFLNLIETTGGRSKPGHLVHGELHIRRGGHVNDHSDHRNRHRSRPL